MAIVGSDLAAAWIAANQEVAATKPDMALQHLLVTRYCDEMSNGALPAGGFPDAWRAWLDLAVDMPTYATAWRDAMAAGLTASAPTAGPDDLAVLPYTSGTTGLPKGCMHTHRTIMHNVVSGAVWANGSSAVVSLAVVPMFHITGMLYGLHVPIYLGSCAVIMPRWDRDVAGRLISTYKVTVMDDGADHDDRPAGQSQCGAVRPEQPAVHRRRRCRDATGGGAETARSVRAQICRRLWAHRDRRPSPPTRRTPQATVPGVPYVGTDSRW